MKNKYQRLALPLLKQIDAESAHKYTLSALEIAQRTAFGRSLLRRIAGEFPQQTVKCCGLSFPNVVGLAAGFDKDIRVAIGLGLLGFGHIEVGTLTPRPQVGNLRPRIFRLAEDEAIINRMGFPNGGVETAVPRLQALSQIDRDFILGVSLGKQKETPLDKAANDYITVMRAVYPYADYLAINVSSPNTPGLRDLQGGDYLGVLLHALQKENEVLAEKSGIGKRPLLVKIAPDLNNSELDEILQAIQANNIAGIIATNTTLSRQGLKGKNKSELGGLSGRPLTEHSTAFIRTISQKTNGNLPIIGVGGVATAVDVQAKLDAGATLVQLYTSLIYEGPGVVGSMLRELAKSS